MDTLSGVRVWERTFPFPKLNVSCWGRWLSLQAELERGERHHLEVLDALTGETVWSRTDPEAPPQKGARSHIPGIFGDGIALLYSRPVEDVMGQRSFIRLATGEHLWTTHEISSVCFASGRIVWLYERTASCCDWNRYYRCFETKVETESISARDVETGAELMRIKGNPSPFAFAGRVYTRSGKKLTCWGLPAEAKRIPAAARERKSLSLVDTPAVASATERKRGAVPANESEWEDLWFELEVSGETGRVPIRAFLDALRKKYAGTVLHQGGVLEVHDAAGQYWGSLLFDAQFLPEDVSEPDADTRIAGFRLCADEAVRTPIHAVLRKLETVWDVTN